MIASKIMLHAIPWLLDGDTEIGGELTEGGLGTTEEMRGTVRCRVAALHASPWRADGSLVDDTVAGKLGAGTDCADILEDGDLPAIPGHGNFGVSVSKKRERI
jgi:hypothetical protein